MLLAKCENGEFGGADDGEPRFMSDDGNLTDNGGYGLTAAGGRPGKGGRGGGGPPAAMTWLKGADKTGAAFKESVLPAGAVASLKQSRLVGRSVGRPGRSLPARAPPAAPRCGPRRRRQRPHPGHPARTSADGEPVLQPGGKERMKDVG